MLHGQPRYGIVSRFVEEIPPQLCKWIVLPEKQFETAAPGACAGDGGCAGARAAAAPRSRSATATTTRRAREFEKKRPDEQPFAIGQSVRHAKFGDGRGASTSRAAGSMRACRCASPREGTKWLALQYAKLTAV